jgi:hypothetical protein
MIEVREGSGPDLDLGVAQETEIFRTVRTIIDQKKFFTGRMRIVAAGAPQFLSLAGRIKFSHDGMIITEPIPAEDMLSIGLVGMAILAEQAYLLGQETRNVRSMGIMAGQAIAASYRRMDDGFRKSGLVMALETKIGYSGRERQHAFFLCMRGRNRIPVQCEHTGSVRDG